MWAYRSSQGGDSASAAVVVSAGCGNGLAVRRPLRRSPQPSARAARGRLPHSPPKGPSRKTLDCSDSVATAGDAGTDSLPLVPLVVRLETAGITSPIPADTTRWPTGTVLPFAFAALPHYQTPLVFVDDTLSEATGTVVMSTAHTIAALADQDFNQDPEVSALRTRLQTLVNAHSPQAYGQYLAWLSDSSSGATHSPDSLSSKLQIAEYLQFDLTDPTVRSAIRTYIQALGTSAFELGGPRGSSSVHIIDSATYFWNPPLANRRPPPITITKSMVPRRMMSEINQPKMTYIYVNGINTSLKDTVGEEGTLSFLRPVIRDDSVLSSNAVTTYFWNRDVAGQLAAFDSSSSCSAQAVRSSGILHPLYAAARFVKCDVGHNAGRVARHVMEADWFEAFLQYVTLHVSNRWPIPAGALPAPVDADSLAAQLAAYYHRDTSGVIFVAHSQGNLMVAQAARLVPQLDVSAGITTPCLGAVALASPISRSRFDLDGMIQGMIMHHDILLAIGADNDMTHTDDDRSFQADAEINAASNDSTKKSLAFHWGPKIHEVNYNYLTYPASIDSVRLYLRTIRHTCLP